MKQIFISILAIAALASCSKNETDDTTGLDEQGTIVLSAGVPLASVKPEGKSPIVNGSTFVAGIAGWETDATVDYTQAESWITTTSTITASPDAQAVTLADSKTYNANNATKTYIQSWYPQGTLASGVVSFTSTDGSVDAMLSTAVVGSKNDRTGKTLAFVHKTTQLKFIVKKGLGLADGTTIDNITIKNAQLPIGFTLSTGVANYAAASDLNVSGITAGALIIGTTSGGDAAGNPVMIKPMTGNTVTLDITTNNSTYAGVTATIDTDLNFVEGRAYTITLTFGQAGIELSTTVENWTAGTGSGNIQ